MINENQYKLIKNCFIILEEEEKKEFEEMDHTLMLHCINILEGFEGDKEFYMVKDNILIEVLEND